jgi:undecaprenyl diphosphate synthase
MRFENLPTHVAIIMDGNGRWAKRRNLPRFQGHLEGVKRVEEITATAGALGIKVLTLFTFSTENWQRPKDEVSMLMKTLCAVLDKNLKKLVKQNVCFQFIGRREGIPPNVLKQLEHCREVTKNNTGLTLNLAFNYGSRLEILDAVKKVCQDVQKGKLAVSEIDEDVFSQALYTKDLPDPDLLIRTSGEKRISNFLLWQLSYAEFYFTDKCWPEFDEKEFKKALSDYEKRERRYGKITEQVKVD